MNGPWNSLVPYLRSATGIGSVVSNRIWFTKAPQNAGQAPYFIVTGATRYDNGHHTTGATNLKRASFKIIGVANDTAGAQIVRQVSQAISDNLQAVIGQRIGDYWISGFWLEDDLMEGWADAPDSDEQGLHTEVLPYKVGFWYSPVP